MKLNEQERKMLAIAIAPAVVALKLTTAPPKRDGSAKKVSVDFAAAVWVRRYTETIVKVLEQEREPEDTSGGGFPS